MNFDIDRPEDYVGCLFAHTSSTLSRKEIYLLSRINRIGERRYALINLSNGVCWSTGNDPFGSYLPENWELLSTRRGGVTDMDNQRENELGKEEQLWREVRRAMKDQTKHNSIILSVIVIQTCVFYALTATHIW